MNNQSYKNKNVLVLGVAKSGFAASMLLKQLGANVTINDKNKKEDIPFYQTLKDEGFTIITDHHPLEILEHVDIIVKNPGIPYSNPLLEEASKRNIPIITEVELGYTVTDIPFIGITGSNGKTTTTTLIHEIVKRSHYNPSLAGNIGFPVCEQIQKTEENPILITELSSFQLMGTSSFRPSIGVLLNLSEAHLDYHGSLEEYFEAKMNLFQNQLVDDIAVLNYDDDNIQKLLHHVHSRIRYFSTTQTLQEGAYLQNGFIYVDGERFFPLSEIVLLGKHNIENILASILVAKALHISDEDIRYVLRNFQGVKHRLSYVTTMNERKFYNDSKATNIQATQKALSSFQDPVILLAGGLDRGNSFDDLLPFLTDVKGIVSFGETAPRWDEFASRSSVSFHHATSSIQEAIDIAYGLSEEKDVILLSPACASWDQFKSFEERGDYFVSCVNNLKDKNEI